MHGPPSSHRPAQANGGPPADLWERLRQHKVVQWGLVYAAAAYTVLHGVEMVSDALEWPHLIVRVVTLALLLGLPITITLAWFQGHRALHRVSGTELLILTVLLALAGGVLWVLGRPGRERSSATLAELAVTPKAGGPTAPPTAATQTATIKPPEKSVAVLPFVNMSDDKNNDYFADGLSEELIDLLTKIHELRVPARTSSFYFKGRDATVAEIAKALNVSHIMEGSVRRSGQTLRVTAQLIRVDNGYHVWSETYDRKLDDIFKIQDDIAGAVVKALKVSLLEGESLPTATTTNRETYQLYLQARSLRHRGTEADVDKAIEYLRQATRSDPKFAPAWAQLALALNQNWFYWSTLPFEKARAEANAAADEAIRLDPELAAGHAAKGMTSMYFDWDWGTAGAELQRALQLDPGDAEALVSAAWLSTNLGRLDEAIQFGRDAAVRDPLGAGYQGLGFSYFYADRLVEGEAAFRKSLELSPAASETHYLLGLVLLAKNQPAAALAEMEREQDENWRAIGLPMVLHALGRQSEADQALVVLEQKFASTGAYNIAEVYALRNEPDQAFAWLDRAYRQRDSGLPEVKVDALLKNIRRDPRYKVLVRKMKLPE